MANVSLERKTLLSLTCNLFSYLWGWDSTISAPVWGSRNSCFLSSWQDLTGHVPKALSCKSLHNIPKMLMCVAEEDEWFGKAWPCYALPVGHMIFYQYWALAQVTSGTSPAVQELIASLVGAQAEVARPVQDSTAVSVGTMERSILLLSVLFCPTALLLVMIYMLGCAFFILPIAHTRVLVFRVAMCFLMWIFSHMWISRDTWMLFHVFSQSSVCFQSDSYPHLITRLCPCLSLGNHIPLLISSSGVHWHCCGIGQWHGPPGGFGSTLLLWQVMETLSTYLAIQLSILQGQSLRPL